MIRLAIAVAIAVMVPAAEPVPFVYPVLEHRVVDGDTIAMTIDLGFDLRLQISARLDGLNAPEVTGAERAAGTIVAERVRQWLAQHPRVLVQSTGKDKYAGRFVGVVMAPDGSSLNAWLLRTGLAVPYTGDGPVPRFTESHLARIVRGELQE